MWIFVFTLNACRALQPISCKVLCKTGRVYRNDAAAAAELLACSAFSSSSITAMYNTFPPPSAIFPCAQRKYKIKKKRKKINFNFNFEYEFDNNAGVGNNAGERRWQPAKGVKRKQTREAVDRVKRFLKSLIK